MNKAQQASVELRAMDELAAQDSPMHRLSPLSKLFVTVLYIVVTVSFHKYDISGVFVMVLFPLVGYQGRHDPGTYVLSQAARGHAARVRGGAVQPLL